jgi:hypothetical protein
VSEKMVLSWQKRVLLLQSSFPLLQSTPTCEGESERVDKGGCTVASRLVARKEKIENMCARARSSNQPTKGTLVGKVCWDIDVVFEDLLQTNGGLELISVA